MPQNPSVGDQIFQVLEYDGASWNPQIVTDLVTASATAGWLIMGNPSVNGALRYKLIPREDSPFPDYHTEIYWDGRWWAETDWEDAFGDIEWGD